MSYGITPNKDVIVTILSSVAFLTAVMGISTNIIKLSELQTKLKGLQDE